MARSVKLAPFMAAMSAFALQCRWRDRKTECACNGNSV